MYRRTLFGGASLLSLAAGLAACLSPGLESPAGRNRLS